MSLPRYPTYKDSEVEWLGELPGHWEVRRLKRACSVFPSNVDKKTHEGETPVLLCNYTDVYYNDTIVAGMELMAATASSDQIAKFTLRAGDTIITKDSETADDIAIAAFVPADLPGVVCGYHLSMVRPSGGANGAFVKRLFDSSYAKSCFAVRANGLTRVGLGQYEIDNVELPWPPLPEQAHIAAFLDRETAKIDALVAEQMLLIELLKEKRRALIAQTVTKGLNPDAPMKDSGIEWLGEMPAHWEVKRLKNLSPRISGRLVYQPAQYFVDDGVPFLMGNNVTERGVKWDDVKFIPEHVNKMFAHHALQQGDVITVRVGAPGLTCVVPKEAAGINCGSLMIIRRSPGFDSAWLSRVMNSFVVQVQIDRVQYGAAQEQINITDAVNFLIPTPPLLEQQAIAHSLASSLAEFDTLTAEAQRAIELLQERRTALISAAVTGQIDVRPVAA